MNTNTYTYLGGTDLDRVNSLGMFSAAGTDAVISLITDAVTGSSVADLKARIAAIANVHREVYDTAVRDEMVAAVPARSPERQALCDALGVSVIVEDFGAEDVADTMAIIHAARMTSKGGE